MTEETTETLYRIGAGDLVVGVSGFTRRPKEARDKPHISTFLDANFEEILDLKPDIVIGFSDLQADLGRELAKRGVPVAIFNQRSIAEILQTVRVTAALVGKAQEGEQLADELQANVERHASQAPERRPRVFFEEWPDPLISGIRWVSELIEIAGGEDVCMESREHQDAKGRIYEPQEVASRDPEIVIASWCGKAVKRDEIEARAGWSEVTAIGNGAIHEVDSTIILQPGPAALTDGLDELARIIALTAGS